MVEMIFFSVKFVVFSEKFSSDFGESLCIIGGKNRAQGFWGNSLTMKFYMLYTKLLTLELKLRDHTTYH